MDYQEINAETIDRWVDNGWEWGKPISHEEYVRAVHGIWDVMLTPTKKSAPRVVWRAEGKENSWSGKRRRTANACFCRTWRRLYRSGLFCKTARQREVCRKTGKDMRSVSSAET